MKKKLKKISVAGFAEKSIKKEKDTRFGMLIFFKKNKAPALKKRLKI